MNAKRYKTQRGGRWSAVQVMRVLTRTAQEVAT
jgi:hypothetical protein